MLNLTLTFELCMTPRRIEFTNGGRVQINVRHFVSVDTTIYNFRLVRCICIP